jgi:hypothetical protein
MTTEPAFVPDYLTLSEAVSHLERKTGRPWDVSVLLGFCAQKHIPMHAAVPRNARAVQCEVTDVLPLTFRPVKGEPYTVNGQTYAHYRPAIWRMAVAYPITIAHVWQTGCGDVAHGVPSYHDHDPEMVMFVNDQHEPVTHQVTAADLRVCRETLTHILGKWRELQTPRLPTATEHDAIQFEPAPAVELKPTKAPNDKWTPADYAEMLRQYEYLTDVQKEKADVARQQIADAWGYEPDSIRGFVTKARKQR